jgi:tRNA-dihydrouridine synthase A
MPDGKKLSGKIDTHRLCVAPMLDWTDRHCRYFLRLLSRHALLYSEMLTCGALLRGDAERLLEFSPEEKPLALQLGGSEPADLARCARMGEDHGYDEINLNAGCPSPRVKRGRFGACLMHEPNLVAECMAAMRAAVSVPVTVKCRIGVDDLDRYEDLRRFVGIVAAAGCRTFIIHARKAWLHGLSPEENRSVPPLRYDLAARVKADFPGLVIVLNGGIVSLDMAEEQLRVFDGVMIGRAAYHDPYLLADADRRLFGDPCPAPSRRETALALLPYIRRERERGVRLHAVTRHVLGLFHGQPGGRIWRRRLSLEGVKPGAGEEVIVAALREVEAVARTFSE